MHMHAGDLDSDACKCPLDKGKMRSIALKCNCARE